METVTQQELLERTPPGKAVLISDFEAADRQGMTRVRTPEITLHCGQCSGDRFFAPTEQSDFIGKREPTDTFLNYVCRNCRKSFKTLTTYQFATNHGFEAFQRISRNGKSNS
jgi:hypothetical protein